MAERRRPRALTSEERRIWRLYTERVRPLKQGEAAPPAPLPPAPAAPAAPAATRPVPRLPAPHRHAALPELGPGQAIGLDKATAERLRRGELPIEARLDLHGLTQVQAHESLQRFLAVSQAQQRRCVLVITGKGFRAKDGQVQTGILRATVPRWLNEAPNRGRILGFAAARDRHGGGGALYVLLKRLR
jgi:DNA-nicking Smr family endonuclease